MLRLEPPVADANAPGPPPVQILDAIDFEERFKSGKVTLVTFNSDSIEANAIEKVDPSEKRRVMATYTMSSIGLGLGCTFGILLKFTAPVAIGGAGLFIATNVMIGLTAGAGLLAIGLAFFVHKFYTKEAIKNIGIQLAQLAQLKIQKKESVGKLLNQINQNFGMLLKMKLALEQLKRSRERINPETPPSRTEQLIQARIESYINFLVKHPDHPNFQKIQNIPLRETEIQAADDRQKLIKAKLDEACEQLINKNTTENIDQYLKEHSAEIRKCFPSLELAAPRTKPPRVITNPAIGLSFLGTFSGVFGLSFLSITLITTFATVSMAFPPLYVILGLAVVIASCTAYTVYKTKTIEAERSTKKKDKQKKLSYYFQETRKLERRCHHEQTAYSEYQAEVTRSQDSPQPSPESKKGKVKSPGLAIFFNGSSDVDLQSLDIKDENTSFRDPSKIPESLPSLVPLSPCRSCPPLVSDAQKIDEEMYEEISPRQRC